MYIIGIDFGIRETTASYIDTDNSIWILKGLHILDGDSDESNKVESAVCRDSITGEWRLAKDYTDYSSPGFSLHFKAPMNQITSENKEAFKAFIQLVYNHILSNNSFLKKSPFCIYAACPSSWDNEGGNQIKQYKEFLSEVIPVEGVIKKMDAVYYNIMNKFKIQSSTILIIDINSHTIDFVSYNEYGLEYFNHGFRHGASCVEESICKYFRENDINFREAELEAFNAYKENNQRWHSVVRQYVRGEIEDFYTKKLRFLVLDLSGKQIGDCLSKRVFDSVCISKLLLENTILKDYKLLLRKDMEYVKRETNNPNIVFLIGEASYMSWLEKLAKEVFCDSKVYSAREPSYVISDGLALYGMESFKSKTQIEKEILIFGRDGFLECMDKSH